MRDYEVLYIVRPDLDDDKVQDAVKRVNTLIERSGGSAEHTNLWGKRKLAYEVKHQKEGSTSCRTSRSVLTACPSSRRR